MPEIFAIIAVAAALGLAAAWAWRESFYKRGIAAMAKAARDLSSTNAADGGEWLDDRGSLGEMARALDQLARGHAEQAESFRQHEQSLREELESARTDSTERSSGLAAAANAQQAELETLRESQARYRAVIGQTADGFFLANAGDKRVLEFNPAFRRMLGYTKDETRLLSVYDFEVGKQSDVDAVLTSLAKAKNDVLFKERHYRRKDGSVVDVEINASTIFYRSRENFCVVVHDITERKRTAAEMARKNRQLEEAALAEREALHALKEAQSHLIQSEKMASLGQMVAGVAHEINNPLAFVNNNVAVLQRDVAALKRLLETYRQGEPTLREHQKELMAELDDLIEAIDLPYTLSNMDELMSRSREGLRRIQQIVQDLRDFARLDESDLKAVDLNDGIASTVNMIRTKAKERNIHIDAALTPLPAVECYPAKVNQVVMNLLANAIDASPDGAEVKIATAPWNGGVRIDVIDTGTGITPEVRKKLFDPFFTTKPVGKGTGLGLSISYGIVHDHGGSIEVESEPGHGATFTVKLPATAKNASN